MLHNMRLHFRMPLEEADHLPEDEGEEVIAGRPEAPQLNGRHVRNTLIQQHFTCKNTKDII